MIEAGVDFLVQAIVAGLRYTLSEWPEFFAGLLLGYFLS